MISQPSTNEGLPGETTNLNTDKAGSHLWAQDLSSEDQIIDQEKPNYTQAEADEVAEMISRLRIL